MLCRDSDSGIGIPFSVQCVRFCLLSLCIHQCCISVSLTFGFAFSCDCDCVSLWINMPLTACSNIQRKGNTFCLFCFIVVWIFFFQPFFGGSTNPKLGSRNTATCAQGIVVLVFRSVFSFPLSKCSVLMSCFSAAKGNLWTYFNYISVWFVCKYLCWAVTAL